MKRSGARLTVEPAAALIACAALLLGACADQTELRKTELAQLAQWLPGRYDNAEQAAADSNAGKTPHEALQVVIVPVYAPALGEQVFYAQEMAADDPLRVLSQRLLAFNVSKDGKIVQSLYTFAEPARWRDGHLNPDLFKSLMSPDLKPAPGCEVLWTKQGERFTGANERARCRASSRATGEPVQLESRSELGSNELGLSDRSYDASGRLVYGSETDPFYRFRKRGEP